MNVYHISSVTLCSTFETECKIPLYCSIDLVHCKALATTNLVDLDDVGQE